jgi:hypothetical protein
MGTTERISWETLRSIDSATLTGSYQNLGTPLKNPGYIVKLVNNSTSLVTISIDGINDVDVAPASSFWLYDESKTGINSHTPSLPAGTQIMVKGSAGTGLIYLVVQFLIQG